MIEEYSFIYSPLPLKTLKTSYCRRFESYFFAKISTINIGYVTLTFWSKQVKKVQKNGSSTQANEFGDSRINRLDANSLSYISRYD